ncbi:MAG: DUF3833 domain-containing protein [Agarilytica sp.]
MKPYNIVLYILLCIGITACGQAPIQSYTNSKPTLNLREFFNGDLVVYGILQDRKGKVTRKFTATIDARWEGNAGYLNEVFFFDDGTQDTRNWVLQEDAQGNVTGTAGDVVGIAKGQLNGSTLHWRYTLAIPYKNSTLNVAIDDWLYLVTRDRLLNKSVLKKWGFRVGELTLVIEKQEPAILPAS